jgi:hypothetical protein
MSVCPNDYDGKYEELESRATMLIYAVDMTRWARRGTAVGRKPLRGAGVYAYDWGGG